MRMVDRENDDICVSGEVSLDNLADFCQSLEACLKPKDVVSISFESLDSKGSAILVMLIFLRKIEKDLSARVTFKSFTTKAHDMARLAGLSEELGL